jgi:hypothetical protein
MPARALLPTLLLSALLLAHPTDASAVDMTGRVGLGALVDSHFGTALSGRYWVSNLGLEGLLGMSLRDASEPDEHATEFRLGGRVLYALTRTREVNFDIGVGLSTFIKDGARGTDNPLYVDVLLAPSFHLDQNFAVSGAVGLTLELSSDPRRTLTSGTWGASFHYYF